MAATAGYPGTYRAWLSSPTSTVASRFTKANVRYALSDGTVIGNDWADLTDGTLAVALGLGAVWTATTTAGDLSVIDGNCQGWTTKASEQYGVVGNLTAVDSTWTAWGAGSCVGARRLLCVEQ